VKYKELRNPDWLPQRQTDVRPGTARDPWQLQKSERDEEEKKGTHQPGPICLQKNPHPVWFSELLFV
jgi:hypothetical protein